MEISRHGLFKKEGGEALKRFFNFKASGELLNDFCKIGSLKTKRITHR